MNRLQTWGGIAALIEALTFIIGFGLYFTLLADYGSLADPLQGAAFVTEHQVILYVWNLTIYLIFGIFLVILTQAIHARLKAEAPILSQTAALFGIIWSGLVIASGMVANIGASVVAEVYQADPAQAASVWLSRQFVIDGLGGGNEIVGGLWVLLLSLAALRSNQFPKLLNSFGIFISCAGILTMIPVFAEIGGAIFGLGLILWFICLGLALLFAQQPQAKPLSAKVMHV